MTDAPAADNHDLRPLRKVTVNLVPRAADALELAIQLSGDSQTDTINRALQAYAWLLRTKNEGSDILVRENQEHGSVTSRLEFL